MHMRTVSGHMEARFAFEFEFELRLSLRLQTHGSRPLEGRSKPFRDGLEK